MLRPERPRADPHGLARERLATRPVARGVGDLDRAWSAAIAAWVRSTLDPAATAQLRVDLDRVVEQALIPERARSNPAREGADQVGTLRAEWSLVKENWK